MKTPNVYADIIVKGKAIKTRVLVPDGDMLRLLRTLFYAAREAGETWIDPDYVCYFDWKERANEDPTYLADAYGGGQKDRRRLP